MNNLSKLRKEKGLSQAQFAKKIGVAQNTISQWERGVNDIDSGKIAMLCEFFKVTSDYLLAISDDPTPPNTKKDAPTLTAKDERDIEKSLEETLAALEDGQAGLMFDGEPLDDITRDLLAASLRNSMEMAKKLAKEKYGRKKAKE